MFNLLFVPAAHAVTASPHAFTGAQPDGTPVVLQLHGDEYSHWLEDPEGFTVLQDQGRFVYGNLDSNQSLVPTAMLVGKSNPRAAGFMPRMRPAPQKIKQAARLQAQSFKSLAAQPLRAVSTGNVKNLVVLCMFSDHTPGAQTRNKSDYEVLMSSATSDAILAPTGSVHSYYNEASYGKLNLESTVVEWVVLPQTEAWYANGQSGLGAYPQNAQKMVEDALNLVDPQVDFSQFDANNDGYADCVTVIHSGYGAESGGDVANRMWSHQAALTPLAGGAWTSGDGNAQGAKIKVREYLTVPALWGNSGTDITRVGVICHEMGHILGLPELYDTDKSSKGLGNWDVMANSWGFDGLQLHPPHPSAWSKILMGWVTPTMLLVPGRYSAPQIERTPAVYKIPFGFSSGEYLLIENREPVGFESDLPQGGLAIYHVDETKTDNDDEGYPDQSGWPANNHHYKVALLSADGQFGLEKNSDFGDASDLFRKGGVELIGPDTAPNTRTYQDGALQNTGNTISDISAAGDVIAFTYNRSAARYACTTPLFDDIGAILTSLGYSFDEIKDEALLDYNTIKKYDVIFANCSGYSANVAPLAVGALRQFIGGGGALYASDYAYDYVQSAFSDVGSIQFYSNPKIGYAGQTIGISADAELADFVGATTVSIKYDLNAWVPIKSVSASAFVYLRGDIPVSQVPQSFSASGAGLLAHPAAGAQDSFSANMITLPNAPLCAGFRYGKGEVIYTSFHNEAQIPVLQQRILQYLVLRGSTARPAAQNAEWLGLNGASDIQENRGIFPGADAGSSAPPPQSYAYSAIAGADFDIILNWPGGGPLRLDVFRPDGTLYESITSATPVIAVVVPATTVTQGLWTYSVSRVRAGSNAIAYAISAGQVLDAAHLVRYEILCKNALLTTTAVGIEISSATEKSQISITRLSQAPRRPKSGMIYLTGGRISNVTIAGSAGKVYCDADIDVLQCEGAIKSFTSVNRGPKQISAAELGQIRMSARPNSSADATSVAAVAIEATGPSNLTASVLLNGVTLREYIVPQQKTTTLQAATKKYRAAGGETFLSFGDIGAGGIQTQELRSIRVSGGAVQPSEIVTTGAHKLSIAAFNGCYTYGRRGDMKFLARSGDVLPIRVSVAAPSLSMTASGGNLNAKRIDVAGEIPLLSARWRIYHEPGQTAKLLGGVLGDPTSQSLVVATGGSNPPTSPALFALAAAAAVAPRQNIGTVYGSLGIFGVFSAGAQFDGPTPQYNGTIKKFVTLKASQAPASILAESWWFQVKGKAYTKKKALIIPPESDHLDQSTE
ncbi:MAG: M6 family metalloprotease domain-containing protein [Candidatus Sumerlaeota bacterium]|nr:M6 family metalloprotease domain-containing protein [Candidatus Sumerlaeota bacterium]